MPTTTPVLLRSLVDDAAVFPPGNAALADAVSGHAVHRSAWYAECVGPLLVPAAAVADLVRLLDEQDAAAPPVPSPSPSTLVLVARPGADPATVTAALDALRDDVRVRVVGAEFGVVRRLAQPRARRVLRSRRDAPRCRRRLGRSPRSAPRTGAGVAVVAKFRTGPTPPGLARRGRARRRSSASRRPRCRSSSPAGCTTPCVAPTRSPALPEENHGVLNVLLATSAALDGAGHDEVTALLGLRDAAALADLVAAWPDATAARVRAAFTAYGLLHRHRPAG